MTSSARTASIAGETTDLIPAFLAAKIVCASSWTLARWAEKGLLREFSHPERTCRFYSRAECEKLRPRPMAKRRPARVPLRTPGRARR